MTQDEFARENYQEARRWSENQLKLKYDMYLMGYGQQNTPTPVSQNDIEAEKKRIEALRAEEVRKSQEAMRERLQRQEEERKRIERENYLSGNWDEQEKHRYASEWMQSFRLSRQQIYDNLRLDVSEPWIHINNCLGGKLLKPDDVDKFAVESFYNYEVPFCGAMWRWMNDPNVDHGSDQYIEAAVRLNGIRKWTRQAFEGIKGEVKSNLSELSTPFYTVAAVGGIAALAFLTYEIKK